MRIRFLRKKQPSKLSFQRGKEECLMESVFRFRISFDVFNVTNEMHTSESLGKNNTFGVHLQLQCMHFYEFFILGYTRHPP